ncbi:hypothetical protein RUM43_010881 [Polyplax serrata]|uniref:Spaetzle domain-containing protein n=1 Tax=Polyplax serrata TaxID=468196 RepID=A0AAN8NL22_POLSC
MSIKLLLYKLFFFALTQITWSQELPSCNKNFKYLYGDALQNPEGCIGPNGLPYPTELISRTFKSSDKYSAIWPSERKARLLTKQTLDPKMVQKALLRNFEAANGNVENFRMGKSSLRDESSCPTPARLCKTRYNTTAPMYGVSLTSGQPVTIVQKFPDLLQQVVFEVCESSECDVVRGECTQTYVPYLFLVIPLGPVTLTGQDYVLVESGCTCRPKYSNSPGPSPVSALPSV